MEQINSYNPGARTGRQHIIDHLQDEGPNKKDRLSPDRWAHAEYMKSISDIKQLNGNTP